MKNIAVFISIPKNASRNIRWMLDLGPARNIDCSSSLIIDENHRGIEDLSSRYSLENLFVFCFSRNPYARCISWYIFHRDALKINLYRQLSFREWVMAGMPHHWHGKEAVKKPLLQYSFVKGHKVDFIGRLEYYGRDQGLLIDSLNHICQSKQIPHQFNKRQSRHTHGWRSIIKKSSSVDSLIFRMKEKRRIDKYYIKETKDKVYSLLEQDFDYFKYPR